MKLLIRQGRLVDPVGGIGGVLDILIEDGKVAVIGSDLRSPGAQIIDAKGLTVCAGLVDMHVHLREPGFEYKETIATGARAAAAGGFTAIACMPNTRPVIDIPEGVVFIKEKSAQAGGAQVFPIAAVSKGQKGQEVNDFEALKAAGAVALSDDGVPVQNANLLRDAMILAHRQELTILSHCEDADMVQNFAVNEGRVSRRLRIPGRRGADGGPGCHAGGGDRRGGAHLPHLHRQIGGHRPPLQEEGGLHHLRDLPPVLHLY